MAYLRVTRKIYSNVYSKKISICYKHLGTQIKQTELKITEWPSYNIKLHGRIVSGKYRGMLHARLTDNIRVVYQVINGNIIFMDILTKNEFDKLCG